MYLLFCLTSLVKPVGNIKCNYWYAFVEFVIPTSELAGKLCIIIESMKLTSITFPLTVVEHKIVCYSVEFKDQVF